MLKYLCRIVTGKHTKLAYLAYKICLAKSNDNTCHTSWITYVKSIINECGMDANVLQGDNDQIVMLNNVVNSILKDQYTIKVWASK